MTNTSPEEECLHWPTIEKRMIEKRMKSMFGKPPEEIAVSLGISLRNLYHKRKEHNITLRFKRVIKTKHIE